jgi:hypothetical protein
MAKRTTIRNAAGTMYAKRDRKGQFREMDEKGRSLAADRRTKAKTTVRKGYGDQGDQKTSGSKATSRARAAGAKKRAASRAKAGGAKKRTASRASTGGASRAKTSASRTKISASRAKTGTASRAKTSAARSKKRAASRKKAPAKRK